MLMLFLWFSFCHKLSLQQLNEMTNQSVISAYFVVQSDFMMVNV